MIANRTNGFIPMLPEDGNNVVLLGELEFGISKDQLNHITNLHKAGMELEDISQEVKRDPYEVLIALIHQAKRGHVLPALAYRRANRENLQEKRNVQADRDGEKAKR